MIAGTSGQLLEFCAFFFSGVMIAVLYSIFFFKKIKNKILNIVFNILFGVIGGAFILLSCWMFVCFDVKFFDVLGIFLGGIVCRLLCGKTLDSIFDGLYNIIVRLVKGVTNKYADERKNNKVSHRFGSRFGFCVGACDDYPYFAKSPIERQGKTIGGAIESVTTIKRRARRGSRRRISYDAGKN